MDVYVEMNLNLRRATKDLDAHELSVRKVDVVAQVLRTIQQVSHVQQIRGAKVPIVKFMHVPTGLSCDISFKNLMSVMNTSFIELSQVGTNRVNQD